MSWIIFLHIVVVVATAIFLPWVLYWFMSSAASDLHNQAMRKQAEQIAGYLERRPDDSWSLPLPRELRDVYSEAYGRYVYTVLDETGRVLFSSRSDRLPIFQLEKHSSDAEFLNIRRGKKIISGVS